MKGDNSMEQFKITLNQDQKEKLIKSGYDCFAGFAEETENMFFYLHSLIEWLECHNKNYTKEQYHRIQIANDLLNALYKGF